MLHRLNAQRALLLNCEASTSQSRLRPATIASAQIRSNWANASVESAVPASPRLGRGVSRSQPRTRARRWESAGSSGLLKTSSDHRHRAERTPLSFRFEGEAAIAWRQALAPQFDGAPQHLLELLVGQTHHLPRRVPDAVHPLSQPSQQGCASHSSEARTGADYLPVTAPIERDVVQVRDFAGE